MHRRIAIRRLEHASGRLDPARVRELESLPGWTWTARHDQEESRNEEGLRRVRAFVARQGHARVPVEYVEPGFRLGLWVRVRRRQYRAGRLTSEQVRQLEALRG